MIKKLVLVIGGATVPRWVHSAFEIQHVGDESGKGKIQVQGTPELIVVNTEFVSHQYSWQAHEIGASLKIPVLHARGGWSSAVAEAARLRLDWFVQAVSESSSGQDPEVKVLVDNAWEQTVAFERDRADAAIKRLTKERTRKEEVELILKRLRSGAEERIVSEIRRRATELRSAAERRDEAVREAQTRLVDSTLAALNTAFGAQEELAKALRRVETTARGALKASEGEVA